METENLKKMQIDIKLLKQAITEINANIIDKDRILDKSDKEALKSYLKEKGEGRLTSHEEVINQLKVEC